jgi:beta-1,4-mannosyl-glycoprotein beta-1,4-N-acetylglucosaminyltransferase
MIVDAFPFFQEVELLKVRLSYLGELVDRFIISESEIDFAGNPKEMHLTSSVISELPYSEKITVVQNEFSQIDKRLFFPIAKRIRWRKPLWRIQLKQRNSILPILQSIEKQGTLLFGDLDEFPNHSKLKHLISLTSKNQWEVYSLNQIQLVYNLRTKDGHTPWHGTIGCSIKNARNSTPNKLRKLRHNSEKIEGGWHFSYFGNKNQIQNKIRSVAPVEKHFNLSNPSLEEVSDTIKSKANPFSKIKLDQIEISIDEYPKELISCFQQFMPSSLTNS